MEYSNQYRFTCMYIRYSQYANVCQCLHVQCSTHRCCYNELLKDPLYARLRLLCLVIYMFKHWIKQSGRGHRLVCMLKFLVCNLKSTTVYYSHHTQALVHVYSSNVTLF